jgi:hypothetical protein
MRGYEPEQTTTAGWICVELGNEMKVSIAPYPRVGKKPLDQRP